MKLNFNPVESLLIAASSLLLLLAFTTSCENDQMLYEENKIESGIDVTSLKLTAEGFNTAFEKDLIAGQHHVAGKVTVASDGANILVTFTTNENWSLFATHLYVGDCDAMPVNGGGNPRIGRFPYKEEHEGGVNSFTYTIPFEEVGECFCFAAHAEVGCATNDESEEDESEEDETNEDESEEGSRDQNEDEEGEDDNYCGEETAWAEGIGFPGRSWAMYSELCVDDDTDEGDEDEGEGDEDESEGEEGS